MRSVHHFQHGLLYRAKKRSPSFVLRHRSKQVHHLPNPNRESPRGPSTQLPHRLLPPSGPMIPWPAGVSVPSWVCQRHRRLLLRPNVRTSRLRPRPHQGCYHLGCRLYHCVGVLPPRVKLVMLRSLRLQRTVDPTTCLLYHLTLYVQMTPPLLIRRKLVPLLLRYVPASLFLIPLPFLVS